MNFRGTPYLILEHSRLTLSNERLLDCIRDSLRYGILVQEMNFFLRGMDIDVDRSRVDLKTKDLVTLWKDDHSESTGIPEVNEWRGALWKDSIIDSF